MLAANFAVEQTAGSHSLARGCSPRRYAHPVKLIAANVPPRHGFRGFRTRPIALSKRMKLKRVPLIVALAAGCLAAPLAAGAQQQAGKLSRVGVLMNLYPPDAGPPQALRQGLRDLGYVEGQNLVIDWRYQLGRGDRLPTLAAELVRLKPDVIVADSTVAIRATMQATSTIPIVMASSVDAVGSGLVTSLGRPGGNVTGITIMLAEMSAKRLQLLKEAAPNVSRVAVLWNPALPWHPVMLKEVDAAAPSLRLQPTAIAVDRKSTRLNSSH